MQLHFHHSDNEVIFGNMSAKDELSKEVPWFLRQAVSQLRSYSLKKIGLFSLCCLMETVMRFLLDDLTQVGTRATGQVYFIEIDCQEHVMAL